MRAIGNWRRFDDNRQGMMQAELDRILKAKKVSKNLFEIATKLRGDDD